MYKITSIFIDDGGVMNDNALRGSEWRRLVGEYFAPRLGGEAAAWSEANRTVFEQRMLPFLEAGPQERDWISWYDARQIQWLREMASFIDIDETLDDVECLDLVWQASDYITQRVHSAFDGAADAVHILNNKGFSLFTASGQHSRELDGYLKGIGIRDCFKILYGSDLINCGKYSAEYYKRIFEHSRVIPSESLVVDDKPEYLAWAASFGAKTCLMGTSVGREAKVDLVVSRLADLPAELEMMK